MFDRLEMGKSVLNSSGFDTETHLTMPSYCMKKSYYFPLTLTILQNYRKIKSKW